MDFMEFPKIARLSRECVITEKIDGTNAQVAIVPSIADGVIDAFDVLAERDGFCLRAGSRNRWITPEADNFGFSAWAKAHADELWTLGEGRHFGEWWGSGIQRGYGLPKGEKRFSLFNVARWHQVGAEPYVSVSGEPRIEPKLSAEAPACCSVVPVLYRGEFTTEAVGTQVERLKTLGSVASPGFMNPEGVVCYHVAANLYFKKTLEKDAEPKTRLRVAVTA